MTAYLNQRLTQLLLPVIAIALFVAVGCAQRVNAADSVQQVSGHIPKIVDSSLRLSPLPASATLRVTFAFKPQDPSGLADLMKRLYDPSDPQYGHYLSPEQYRIKFAPSQEDYEAVADWAKSQGLPVSETHPDRMLLDVSGRVDVIEKAFNINLSFYRAPNKDTYYAPDREPSLPSSIAPMLYGVVGLNNAAKPHPNYIVRKTSISDILYIFTPAEITSAYNVAKLTLTGGTPINGAGQSVALMEFTGYAKSDITAYESKFKLAHVPLKNILIDGATGKPNSANEVEADLDLEMLAAISPGLSMIYVYEAPNPKTLTSFGQELVDLFGRMATDDLANQASVSYDYGENTFSLTDLDAMDASLVEMGTQGQDCYIAAGDDGAWAPHDANGDLKREIQMPTGLPHAVSVGGTTLFASNKGVYQTEYAWNELSLGAGATGGGISADFPIQPWQATYLAGNAASLKSPASLTKRNVPDVSLNADPLVGYYIVTEGQATEVGGTSAAAPLWAGFNAMVNQVRAAYSKASIGFVAPTLYTLAEGANYTVDFHDVTKPSNNGYYKTTTGYDDCTGLGSFNGANLIADWRLSNYRHCHYSTEPGPDQSTFSSRATVAAMSPNPARVPRLPACFICFE